MILVELMIRIKCLCWLRLSFIVLIFILIYDERGAK